MTADAVAKLFDRAERFSAAISAFGGDGCAWSHTFASGETHRYVLRGIKSPERFEDEVLTLAIWLWSLKDYLKERAKSQGKNSQPVEDYVSMDPFLPLCADLANAAKHGKLKNSRSGKWPSLGKVHYSIPQQALRSITFRAFEVETDIARPDLITVTLPVLDPSGTIVGDAFQVLEGALRAWESYYSKLEREH